MTRMQLFAFILQTQVGIGVLSFPYVLHKAAGVDGWISILLAGACVSLLLTIYVALCKRFPGQNLYEFVPLILGKWLGNMVNAIYQPRGYPLHPAACTVFSERDFFAFFRTVGSDLSFCVVSKSDSNAD